MWFYEYWRFCIAVVFSIKLCVNRNNVMEVVRVSIMSFILGMIAVLLSDAVSEWIYAKADELREQTECRRAKRIKQESDHDGY